MKNKAIKPAEPETLIYCGPSLRGIAPQYTAFTGGLPDAVRAQCEKTPALRSLLVPADKLAETRKELHDPDSALSAIYDRIAADMKGVG